MANAPCSLGSTAATASWGDAPRSTSRATRWPTTSVSVSLSNCAAFANQLIAQRPEVLDDAVVDQCDGAHDVRVRVADGRRAVRRPARVSNADAPVQRVGGQLTREIVELPLRPAPDELAVIDGADTGGVIAAILEPLEPVEQPLRDVAIPNNPYNSAHLSQPLNAALISTQRGYD